MDKKNWPLDKNFISKTLIVVIAALVVLYFSQIIGLFKTLLTILFPIILGLIIAYIVNLILKPLEKIFFPRSKSLLVTKIRRPICILLSFIIIIAAIYIIMYLIIPQINDSIMIISEGIPELAEDLRVWFLKVTEGVDWAAEYRKNIENAQINWSDLIDKAAQIIKSSINGVLGSTFTIINSIFGILITTITALIFSISYLSSKEKISSQVKRAASVYLSQRQNQKLSYFISVIDDKYSSFIKSKLVDSLVIGFLIFIMMLILRFPFASTISIVIMVTSIIPVVGAYIGSIIGFLMIAVIDFKQALLFILVLAVVLQLEASIIYPKIAGKSTGLPGIWVFAAVIIGGALAGPIGMLFGVPLAAAIYTFIKNDIKEKEKARTL